MTPIKAIRAKCLDCCGGSAYEVRLCPMTTCSLYIFRFGVNPNKQTSRTQSQLEALNKNAFKQKSPRQTTLSRD